MSDTKEKGYKGHRAGSKAEKAHKLVDENPKAERKDLVAKIKKLGVSDVTAGHWSSMFKNWGKAKAPKVAASKTPTAAKSAVKPAPKKTAAVKPTAKPTSAPVKPAAKAKVKTAPVIKPAAPAAATSAPTEE